MRINSTEAALQSESRLFWLRWLLRACLGAAIMLILVYLVVWRWLGAPEAAWALLRGEELVVIPAMVDLGDCLAGDVNELQFRVMNMSSSQVTLTGIYTSCSCILASSLPVVLDAGGATTLRMAIHSSGDQGRFTRQAVLYTDSELSPQLPILVTGTMLQHDASSDLEPTPLQASVPHRLPAAMKLPAVADGSLSEREPKASSFPGTPSTLDSP